jgi:hypothetical protein
MVFTIVILCVRSGSDTRIPVTILFSSFVLGGITQRTHVWPRDRLKHVDNCVYNFLISLYSLCWYYYCIK